MLFTLIFTLCTLYCEEPEASPEQEQAEDFDAVRQKYDEKLAEYGPDLEPLKPWVHGFDDLLESIDEKSNMLLGNLPNPQEEDAGDVKSAIEEFVQTFPEIDEKSKEFPMVQTIVQWMVKLLHAKAGQIAKEIGSDPDRPDLVEVSNKIKKSLNKFGEKWNAETTFDGKREVVVELVQVLASKLNGEDELGEGMPDEGEPDDEGGEDDIY